MGDRETRCLNEVDSNKTIRLINNVLLIENMALICVFYEFITTFADLIHL